MITLTFPIGAEGALVDASVGLSYPDAQGLRQAGKPVPAAESVRALIDTGAEVTAIDPTALASLMSLGIQPLRFVFVNVPTAGAKPVAEYAVTLVIGPLAMGKQGALVLRNHPVVAQDLALLGYQAIVGRDVLARCLLVYDGPGRTVTLGV